MVICYIHADAISLNLSLHCQWLSGFIFSYFYLELVLQLAVKPQALTLRSRRSCRRLELEVLS